MRRYTLMCLESVLFILNTSTTILTTLQTPSQRIPLYSKNGPLLIHDPDRPRSEEETMLVSLLPTTLSSQTWQTWSRNLGMGDEILHETEMQLGFLRTCRQFYNEATPILWSTNTFSFNDTPTFERFMETRDSIQKKSIRKPRLAIDTACSSKMWWNLAINVPLIRSLRRLRHLELLIGSEDFIHPVWGDDFGLDTPFDSRFEECVRKLSILPLISVHVRIVSEDLRSGGQAISRWTEEDRREQASVLRARLMSPYSADDYARDKQELREKLR